MGRLALAALLRLRQHLTVARKVLARVSDWFLVLLGSLEELILEEGILAGRMCGGSGGKETAVADVGEGGVGGRAVLDGFVEGLADVDL